ncbi:ABC transporter permease [Tolypothrix sp. PCC 7910]|uniref:ABC transporter permease n=1 Tax=Tolypothrix sp. PCC 7910 TaxID=2099387 RepID=UPI0014279BA2|nr:ABC transporter permease [Tolypothrix sp. PCC 7910]QIR35731.1 ABC transporter permease [Tolypothrix sp. PCC 7910]
MMLKWLDKIGDWNPQLLRELKGRLKPVNILIALAISLVTQLGTYIYQISDLPGKTYAMSGMYCNLADGYQKNLTFLNQSLEQVNSKINSYSGSLNSDLLAKIPDLKLEQKSLKQQIDNLNNILYQSSCPTEQINMQMWWQDHWKYIFMTLSVMFIFTLLVAGTYLLINNLGQEERRGTLNFLRLSPQSEASILTGKMLGVPILVYLTVLAALPLHLLAGIAAQIPFTSILAFYIVLAASCVFFYSNALLFGLISRWFSGFQPWLGSGLVLLFLFVTLQTLFHSVDFRNLLVWLSLLNPASMLGYLTPRYQEPHIQEIQFFYLPLGKSLVGLVALHLFNYGVGIYWAWKGMKRRFRNPDGAIINKVQSYLMVASYQLIFWGFTLQYSDNYCPDYRGSQSIPCYYDLNYQIVENWGLIAFFNIMLLLSLLVILSPHRQTIQDWARYRHEKVANFKGFWRKFALKDWLVDEKSPALLAMLINLAIATTPLVVWIVLAPMLNTHHNNAINWVNEIGRLKAILAVAFFISLMMIYATLAQLMLMMKTSKRSMWAVGTIVAAIFLPPLFLGILNIKPAAYPVAWLFSTFPWAGLEYAATSTVFKAFIAELTVLILLNIKLAKQMKLAGESATKALLAKR